MEELITELLLADDCALLTLTEKALWHIVNHFSDAAKNFDLLAEHRTRNQQVAKSSRSRSGGVIFFFFSSVNFLC